LQATPLPGTEDATDPFFSPDGQWIAFFANLKLKKISVAGGGALTLCDANSVRGERGATMTTLSSLPTLFRMEACSAFPQAAAKSNRYETRRRRCPKWQISTAGAAYPTWSRTRHELFYKTADNRIMVAPYTVEGSSFIADKPRVWSERKIQPRPRLRSFDIHPDGERFAISAAQTPIEDRRDKIVFIFNFFDELRRIAPAAKR
jgi:serine/threonine-protein kinase